MSKVVYDPKAAYMAMTSKERYAVKDIPVTEEGINRKIRAKDSLVVCEEMATAITGFDSDLRTLDATRRGIVRVMEQGRTILPEANLVYFAEYLIALAMVVNDWRSNRKEHLENGKRLATEKFGRVSKDDIPALNKEYEKAKAEAVKSQEVEVALLKEATGAPEVIPVRL